MRPGKISRLAALIRKEFIHLRRDPRSLVIIFVMPLVMIFIFGHVLSFDLKKVETLIIDFDQSGLSRELASRFAASPFYKILSLDGQGVAGHQGKKAKISETARKDMKDPIEENESRKIEEFQEQQNFGLALSQNSKFKAPVNLAKSKEISRPEAANPKNNNQAREAKPGQKENRPPAKPDYLTAAENWLRQGKIKQYLYIPRDFEQRLQRNLESQVLIVIDGSDANIANRVYQYDERLLAQFFSRLTQQSGQSMPVRIEIKMFFNPEIISAPFIIPGLVAALMLMISALLTSLSLAREKETGSIQLLFISPLRSSEIIVGKTIPYLLVSLAVGLTIFIFARLFFNLEFRGSYWLLWLTALIYILSGLALGILISTVASSQKVAMIMTLLGTILPSMFLTGFIFPLESLAPVLRAISYIVPATYFLRILRGVALKGASLEHFLVEEGILVAMSLFLLALASKKFQAMRQVKR